MYFSSDERKWITKIRKLATAHPDEVQILAEPEMNDGCIYVAVPSSWLSIRPPKKMNYTDEQRAQIGFRLKQQQCNGN